MHQVTSPEDRIVYQRYVGHPEVRIFDFVNHLMETGGNQYQLSENQTQKMLSTMLERDSWP
jgi:hypothetical protein